MEFDRGRARAFGQRLMELFGAGMLTAMIDVGTRTGLLGAAARGPGTSAEIAERAAVPERTAREWLAAMTTGGIIEHANGVYTLPPEHAMLLTGDSHYNLSPLAGVVAASGGNTDRIARAVVDGRGIDHDEFDDDLAERMDALSRHRFDAMLVQAYLPTTGMVERLRVSGGRIADVGCGAGHAANLMAEAFTEVEVVGVDVSDDALDRARTEADAMGLPNVSFERRDAIEIAELGPFDMMTAFDVIHDLPDPAAALGAIRDALGGDGRLLMYESSAPSDLDEQVDLPWAPLMYGLSVAHCLQVARASGGEGVGSMWGREQASTLLIDSGFTDIEVHDAPGDPINAIYVARRAA